MLNVIKLVGSSLREINLTRDCLVVLRDLFSFCPNVERITLQDCPDGWGCEEGRNEIVKIDILPLRSLSIHTPSYRTLLLIPRIPQELVLVDVQPSNDMFLACKQLLRSPPKRFYIQKTSWERAFKVPEDETPRRCFRLSPDAHPEAHVEISHGRQTFIDCADGIYATRITLHNQYLNQDLSRLSEILITDDISTEWYDKLRDLHLKLVRVKAEGVTNLDWVPLRNADVVEVSSDFLIDTSWFDVLDPVEWLLGAKEVRLLGKWHYPDLCTFFASLARLLDLFTGNVVFLEYRPPWIEWSFGHREVLFKALVMLMSRTLDDFEARGGDASTVRSMIDCIDWMW